MRLAKVTPANWIGENKSDLDKTEVLVWRIFLSDAPANGKSQQRKRLVFRNMAEPPGVYR